MHLKKILTPRTTSNRMFSVTCLRSRWKPPKRIWTRLSKQPKLLVHRLTLRQRAWRVSEHSSVSDPRRWSRVLCWLVSKRREISQQKFFSFPCRAGSAHLLWMRCKNATVDLSQNDRLIRERGMCFDPARLITSSPWNCTKTWLSLMASVKLVLYSFC